MWTIWQYELRMTLRQRSFYSLLLLWVTVLSLLFLLQSSTPSIEGYTSITATIANVALYIIPLFMLINGSFTVANELENGQFRLISTYPLSSLLYISGKLGGQLVAQAAAFTMGFGISLAIGLFFGKGFSLEWMWAIYLFCIGLIFFFLLTGVTVGSFVRSRWQALTISVTIWFFLVMIWPTVLIGVLGHAPYTWVSPLMKAALFVNPAEFLRIILVIKLGAGAVFGQSYDALVNMMEAPSSWGVIAVYCGGFLTAALLLSSIRLNRRKCQ
ncbi:ABC transporter permease [Bacillus massilinigeriensis]|uniref:ABC transporter permease n=1 Tax=Bacillus mediterraneensis TaxID=1805474 RepID=UPI0008F8A55B|nr:ABC transporter permease [Bacillus mediterraneensis]